MRQGRSPLPESRIGARAGPNLNALLLMNPPDHAAISARAAALWQERGQPNDQDEEIWLEAERQLSAPLPEGESPHARQEKAERQRKDAMAPQAPQKKAAPKPAPAPAGKPLWSQPHGS